MCRVDQVTQLCGLDVARLALAGLLREEVALEMTPTQTLVRRVGQL